MLSDKMIQSIHHKEKYMSKVTTEDCKTFLTAHCGVSPTEKLKRLRKYKDSDGLYIREFSDTQGKVFLVKEMKDQSLMLHESESRELSVKTPSADFDGKKFVKKLIKGLEEGEDYDLLENSIDNVKKMSAEDKKSIAEQFYFCLPDDAYNNDVSTLSQGIDTLFLNGEESYCLFFYDKFKSDLDCGITDILQGILPDYFDKVDEYHFEINAFEQDNEEVLRKLTIKDVITLLQNLGFKYKSENEYNEEGCMLKKLPKNKSPKVK